MSTRYPILDGRSIDRWRVTELKEELKRRKLITRGLKDDLIKRLDEAIRKDEEAFEEEERKGTECDTEPVVKGEDEVAEPQYDKIAEDTMQLDENKTSEVDDTAPMIAIGEDGLVKPKSDAVIEDTLQLDENKTKVNDTAPMGVVGEDRVATPQFDEITEDTVQLDENKTSKVDGSAPIGVIGVDGVANPKYDQITEDSMQLDENTTSKVDKSVPMYVIGEDSVKKGHVNVEEKGSLGSSDTTGMGLVGVAQEVYVETNVTVDEVLVAPITLSETALESNKINMENEDSKPPQIDVAHSNNQVYEVSHDLGSQVKCESFSTDSVSIFEKNELKDNLNAYNVHLELDVVKPEMVQSSSSGGPASGGDLPPPDDQKPCDHESSVDETEGNKSIIVDYSKRDDSADGEFLEKPKHYRAEDSVEEELLEHKQIDSKHNSNEVDDKSDVTKVPDLKHEYPVGAVGTEMSHEKVETNAEKKNTSAASAEEVTLHEDDKEPTDTDSSKKSDNTEGGFMEQLNLDHFPDDDFMEEDPVETKQVNSNDNPSEAGHEIGLTEVPGAKFELIVDSAELVCSSVKKESSSEKKDNDAAPSEKRKSQDGVIDEPPKRQCRWNSESLKVPEPQSSNIKPCTTPKGSFQTTKLENHFSRSDSTVGGDVPKEHIVPPSPKPPTNSLRIDHFLRPFTLKAVQELLAKTGNVCSFWMDQIKTHCYVMYSTVEEAVETRNSVYNIQWPPNGGRLLVAEFVDPQEVKMRVEAPPQSPATPVSTTPTLPVAQVPQPSPSARQQGVKQQNPHALPLQAPPPPLSDPPTRRERKTLPPKPQPEKLEPPIVTLDDLFRKTRATPRIYYLPLAEEQVAAKLAGGDKNQNGRN